MPNKIMLLLISVCLFVSYNATAQGSKAKSVKPESVITGAERISTYLPFLKGKKVAIFANQTSVVGNTHLVDTLHKLGVKITVIFGPEH